MANSKDTSQAGPVAKDTVRKRKRDLKAATQRFLPIAEIRNDTVLLKGGGLRAVIQIEALNYNLKSETEQKSIIAGYESFVNCVTFPIQILIRSTKVNIDPYIAQIKQCAKEQKNERLKQQTESYGYFIEKIVEVADIMQKRFYVIVPFDTGEKKKSGLAQFFTWIGSDDSTAKATQRNKEFNAQHSKILDRLNIVESALSNIGLTTTRLNTQELINLYYQVYNPKTSQEQKLTGDLNTDPLII